VEALWRAASPERLRVRSECDGRWLTVGMRAALLLGAEVVVAVVGVAPDPG
jgi:hypothetical protein